MILLLLFQSVPPAAVSPVSPPLLRRMVDVRGYQVHLYCIGAGSPTVVVVGGAFSFDWDLIQPEVAKRAQICTACASPDVSRRFQSFHGSSCLGKRLGCSRETLKYTGYLFIK